MRHGRKEVSGHRRTCTLLDGQAVILDDQEASEDCRESSSLHSSSAAMWQRLLAGHWLLSSLGLFMPIRPSGSTPCMQVESACKRSEVEIMSVPCSVERTGTTRSGLLLLLTGCRRAHNSTGECNLARSPHAALLAVSGSVTEQDLHMCA